MFFKIGVLKNFAKFTGKHLCWSWFLIKLHVNIVKFLRTAFFLEHLRWLLLSTAINRRYSEKQLPQNSKDSMLQNSISVGMKVYTLQLKQKSTVYVFHGILRNFRTATFENDFEGLLLKEKQRSRSTQSDPCSFRFPLFTGQLIIKS